MYILALDQARVGAWSVFDYEKKELVDYGTFEFDSKKHTYAKTILHIEELLAILVDFYDISAIFLEDINMRFNVQSFKKLAQLQGVLVNFCEKNEYLYGYVAPSQWQNFCCARGRNAKEIEKRVLSVEPDGKKKSKMLSIQFVKDQFGLETENDNLADACSLGWYVVNVIDIQKSKEPTKKAGRKKRSA